ncbi:MAG: pseudouridine synthase [Thiomicrorhabdus sp.]|jgi:tRNA pseudouridine32 synthase/23S rRNA pseudouridine746 synthase|nr:pseudouridine synthase [Thiomicrorhabdus sp.]
MQPQADPFIVPVCHGEIEILYQDEHLLLINKPTGLLSLSSKPPHNQDSVHSRLIKEFPTATLVHRLDLGTSGIMIVALNKAINGVIGNQFQDRTVTKSYTAVLLGHLQEETGSMDFPIAKGEFPLQKVCYETGKKSLTDYRVIERNEKDGKLTTRVEFKPVTGRTHQLRVHSEAFGYPILGCDLYASDEAFFMVKRLMLHATTIEFDHPITGERIYGVSPCPF